MRVVTMGEMMIRFMPHGNLRFEQADEFEAHYGGDESIVAVSLAKFGMESRYITKLPENPLGDIAISKIRAHGVDTDFIARGGERMGINFYENGASMRPSYVLYDRKHSAIAEATPEDFDFDAIFSDADWFHVSGITPAISDNAAELVRVAMQTAKKHGVKISVDLNYRSKLWTVEKAQSVMIPLMEYVDVCIGGAEDAEKVLGYKNPNVVLNSDDHDIEAYKEVFKGLKEKFGLEYVASTLRESHSASDNSWAALLYDGNEFYHTKKYEIHLVDRGGGGASFSAALIYAIMNGFDIAKTGEFAVAAGTVLDPASAREVILHGGSIIVNPCVVDDVIDVANRYNVPIFCGALSASEVFSAMRSGAAMVKIFPGALGGAAYMTSLKMVLPEVNLIPSGGITPDNATQFIKAGACAVSGARTFMDFNKIEKEGLISVTKQVKKFIDIIAEAKKDVPFIP